MHFLSAVQVPLSATVVRGGTSSVPEMVLSSVHPPASSHEHESPVQRCPGPGRATAPVGASGGVEPAYQRWGAEQGAGSASWGATAVFSSDWSGGQSPRWGPARVCPLCYWKNKHCKICLCGFSPFSEILLHSKAMWLFLSSL